MLNLYNSLTTGQKVFKFSGNVFNVLRFCYAKLQFSVMDRRGSANHLKKVDFLGAKSHISLNFFLKNLSLYAYHFKIYCAATLKKVSNEKIISSFSLGKNIFFILMKILINSTDFEVCMSADFIFFFKSNITSLRIQIFSNCFETYDIVPAV